MNPFLELPTGINDKDEELTVRIKPGQIEYYEPSNSGIGTNIIMQSGRQIFTTFSYGEVDDALTSYVKCLKENPGKFGNLAVTLTKRKLPNPGMIALKPEPSKLIIP